MSGERLDGLCDVPRPDGAIWDRRYLLQVLTG